MISKEASNRDNFTHTGNCPTTTTYSSTKEVRSTSFISESLETQTIGSKTATCMKSRNQPFTTDAAKVDDKNVAIGFATYKYANCLVTTLTIVEGLYTYKQFL